MHTIRPRRPAARLIALLGAALATIVLAGCASLQAPVQPPGGLLYTHTRAPLTVDFHGQAAGEAITQTASDSTGYFHDWVFTGLSLAWDDVDVERIAREGGIQRVSFADYEAELYLGFFGRITVHVHGN